MNRLRSNIRSDERVVFFATDAARVGPTWQIPIHAWVHELEPARKRKAMLASLIEHAIGLEIADEARAYFERRVGLMCADNEGRKRIILHIADQQLALPLTTSNGHVRTTLVLDADLVARHARSGLLPLGTVLPDGRQATGAARLIPSAGLSVISDIDDTVKITEVLDKTAMIRRTFLEPFVSVPGMSSLYQHWAARGACLHFVSSSPWHLYEPLEELLDRDGFPARSMSLKMVRIKDRTVMNLLKKGTQTKPAQIEPILERFPQRRFILVGDSGEQDPEVYAKILRAYPAQIQAICIRNVDQSMADDLRYQSAFEGIDPQRWCLFTDPAALQPLVVP